MPFPSSSPLRTIFMGSGDIGIPGLNWLAESPDCEVQAVFTQPDRPAGRKLALTPTAIKTLASERGIPVHQPEKLRDPAATAILRDLSPDLIVVMAYGQILRKEVIELPSLACINLHASLLPRHRGASPIQAAIREGDAETGVTVMYIAEGLDTGDLLLAERCPILPTDTGDSLHDRLAEVAARALSRAIPLLRAGKAPRTPQDPGLATYQGKLNREDGHLSWSDPADRLERLIRAYDPWPGTFTRTPTGKLKIFPPVQVLPDNHPENPPGTIRTAAADGLVVTCGCGSLSVTNIQLEGGKRQDIGAFLRGHGALLVPGQVFS